MLIRNVRVLAALVAGPFLCITAQSQAQWTVTDLSPAGSTSAFAFGNSSANQVGQTGSFAAIWSRSAGSYASLNPSDLGIPADGSRCYAAFGTQQGGFARWGSKTYAGLWTGSAGSWVNLHPGGVGAAGNSIVYGLCATQQVGTYDASGTHATLWTGTSGSWVDLQPVNTIYGTTSSSGARGTNGTYQVGYIFRSIPGVNHASLWAGTPESWTDLTPDGSPNSNSFAYGISTDGTQVVGYYSSGLGATRAYLWLSTDSWTSWTAQSLQPASATSSQAVATTGTEQVGYAVIGGTEHASLWSGTAGSWVDLHPFLTDLGATRSKAWGIWTVGNTTTIVGEAYDQGPPPNNARTFTKAFLLTRVLCSADFNGSGGVDPDDLFAFLDAWFAQNGMSGAVLSADINASMTVDPDDLFAFLDLWFAENGNCP